MLHSDLHIFYSLAAMVSIKYLAKKQSTLTKKSHPHIKTIIVTIIIEILTDTE